VRRNLKQQYLRLGEGVHQMDELDHILNPDALIIGFARRFATYKRATLLFRDLDRLRRILDNPERPVQIIFAGKAHPADEPGKALIKQIYAASRSDEFQGKIILLENYDIEMARYLVSGTDIWLNNPIRPYEASGTSGQKAALNGQPNCSILDGWWAEGYNGQNGWAIGEGREYYNQDVQAEADSLSLYSLLEDEIVPLFFERDEYDLPHRWLSTMKEAIRTCTPEFSMRRMVKEYTTRYYIHEIEQSQGITQDNYETIRTLAAWKERVRNAWPSLELYVEGRRDGQISLGEGIDIHAWMRANDLRPEDLSVELIYGNVQGEEVTEQKNIPMAYTKREEDGSYRYEAHLQPAESGSIAYNVQVVPMHPELSDKYEMNLVRWA
jgi:starch phosphorylase